MQIEMVNGLSDDDNSTASIGIANYIIKVVESMLTFTVGVNITLGSGIPTLQGMTKMIAQYRPRYSWHLV